MSKILIVEDDVDLAATVSMWLAAERHDVEAVHDGEEALHRLNTYHYDAIVLDWDLPRFNGLEVCKRVRSSGKGTRILMLTGKSAVTEKELGLDSGADDYLTKPFEMRELMARVRSLLRRPEAIVQSLLKVADLTLDPRQCKLVRAGKDIQLSAREYALLEFLMRNPNQVFSAEALLNRVWESSSETSPSTVRTFIKQLRQKIDIEGLDSPIQNVHGVGYKIVDS